MKTFRVWYFKLSYRIREHIDENMPVRTQCRLQAGRLAVMSVQMGGYQPVEMFVRCPHVVGQGAADAVAIADAYNAAHGQLVHT